MVVRANGGRRRGDTVLKERERVAVLKRPEVMRE